MLLRQYRIEAGLTQEELAERAGLSVRAISDIERGVKHIPRKETVALLAEALELQGEERTRFRQSIRSQRVASSPRTEAAGQSEQPGARDAPALVRLLEGLGEAARISRQIVGSDST